MSAERDRHELLSESITELIAVLAIRMIYGILLWWAVNALGADVPLSWRNICALAVLCIIFGRPLPKKDVT